ncbi:nicotinate-nucleotide--dimethylbenzimidazole phosphoribosyltransferase [Streptomyces sp. NBC_00401]|uniref:nicotinate-nucleotide--dimethylbenzimidazole phosphoribosyltransferase n=1 Tax=unclassified Streptomyces TaxID=2593676 RepID=UPI0022577BEE|nr:nicotinate-nucleotide--dimethylbenzimidazole phosphoribosyltransferase [Streptomyces sp. NBC_00401]MCX5080500.1 nicotinate-nucleotide--dimethylbenzimidazole phosphoribosyltransferase [Streptomyces sp. NBC_00401]
MTDTGQVPGEGLPENAGTVEQPGVPAPGAYTFLDPSETPTEDDDLLLMPGSQGAWGEPQAAPMPAPHEPGPHETAGRDSGQVDLNGVRVPGPSPAPHPGPARRPLHMGPPVPDGTGSPVRSLADRGPAHTPPNPMPVRQAGPPTGPEYLDIPRDETGAPEPRLGEIPPQGAAPWGAQAPQQGFETPAAEVAQELAPEASAETVVPDATPAAPAAPTQQTVGDARVFAQAPQQPQDLQDLQDPHLAQAEQTPEGTVAPEFAAPEEAPVYAAAPEGVLFAEEQAAPAEYAADYSSAPNGVQFAPVGQGPEDAQFAVQPEPVAAYAGHQQMAAHSGELPVDPHSGQFAMAPEAVQGQHFPQAPAEGPVDQAAQPLGQFVPVEGTIPTTPHLAPTPPQHMVVPPLPEPAAELPGPAAPAAPAPVLIDEAPETPDADQVPQAQEAHEVHVVPETHEAHAVDDAAHAMNEAHATNEPQATHEAPEIPGVAEIPEAAELTGTAGTAVVNEAPEAFEAPAEAAPVLPDAVAEAPVPAEAQPEAAPEAAEPVAPTEQAPVEAEPETLVPAAREADPAAQDVADATPETLPAPADDLAGPAAPGYDEAEREAVLRVMRERRDIRNGFRSDPIPHDVLLRVLEAAHTAPSVGHSQPWDFVVIRSAETRRTMHELAMRQKDAYAKSLPKGRAKQFKELKIEAILDTPVNIVVTADPTRGGRHTLGRHTQPQMAPYSSALAVENLWLAARAEGLGVGWVSFFDEREMVRTLGLPDHLEVVAYLCVGYVDEFPDEPELMQAGWSKRRPLSWVVHEETYGRRALPGEDPHDLLAETVSNIRPLDAKALGEAWERQKRMTKPAGALGMLEIISAQLSGLSRMCPPPIPEPAAVAIFAGDHGVHAQGVTPWPQEVTAQMVANFLGGGAVCNAFANQVGAEVCVIDVGVASELPATPGLLPRKVRAGTADMTTGPALSREDVKAAIEVGIETARDLVAAGNKALLTGEMGIANTTASAALISVYTGVDPSEVTGRGTGINDETHARKVEVVRRALDLHQPDPADPIGVLAAVGGLEHAAMVGLLLGGASLRTPVILDGVSAGAAALVARAVAPEVLAACIAGHRSAEPGHVAALNKLGLRPLIDLDLRLGEGTGALLALPIVQSAARAMHEVATFDSAGVTEK